MSKPHKEADTMKLIDEINRKLDTIEDALGWMIPASDRFGVGDRVEFSRSADRHCIPSRRKGAVRTGNVVHIDGFSVDVLLDRYKRPSKGFHHSFFNPVNGPKLF